MRPLFALSKRIEVQATAGVLPLYELAELRGTGKMQPFDERFAEPVVLAQIR